MNEFLNRITAQRIVVRIVNKEKKFSFPLIGLSAKALERWKFENAISDDSKLLNILYQIASKLFFLANKSQEQITDEYKLQSVNISKMIDALENSIKSLN